MSVCKGGGPRTAARLLACALLAAPAVAQKDKAREPRPAVDPYTRGEAAALEKAGYKSLGPFQLGAGVNTDDVVKELGGEPILWVETAHFRIGSSLDAYPLAGEGRERKQLHAELKQLAKRLPNVKVRPKELDPWLRLHLWAMRAETLYADFCKDVGVTDADFADGAAGGKLAREVGTGPYLGMRQKFTLLLFERTGSMSRYTNTYCGGSRDGPFRHFFVREESMLLALSPEITGLESDVALQCAATFIIVESFLDAFRGFSHLSPVWLDAGLARVYARRVDPTVQVFTSNVGDTMRGEDEADWEPKVRARVEHRYFPTSAQMLEWKDLMAMKFADHMMAWSRVDFLMRREGPAKMKALLWHLKEPVPWDEGGKRDERIAEQVHSAVRAATGLGPEEFDAAWSAWVLETYREK